MQGLLSLVILFIGFRLLIPLLGLAISIVAKLLVFVIDLLSPYIPTKMDEEKRKYLAYPAGRKKVPNKPNLIMQTIDVYLNSYEHYNPHAASFYCEKLYQLGAMDHYPESYLFGATLGLITKRVGEPYSASNMGIYLEKAHMQCAYQHFLQYFSYCDVDMDRLIFWCRARVENQTDIDRKREGLILLRHFLVFQPFMSERGTNEQMVSFIHRMAKKYQVREFWAQYGFALEHKRSFERSSQTQAEMEAWRFAACRNDHLSLGRNMFNITCATINDKDYSEDWEKTYKWQKELLNEQCATLPADWYEQEVAKANRRTEIIKMAQGSHLTEYFWRGLCCRATGKDADALQYMQPAALADNVNAMYWESCHGPESYRWNNIIPDEISGLARAEELRETFSEDGIERMISILRNRVKDPDLREELIVYMAKSALQIGTERAYIVYLLHIPEDKFREILRPFLESSGKDSEVRRHRRFAYLALALRQKDYKDCLRFIYYDADLGEVYRNRNIGEMVEDALSSDGEEALANLGGFYFMKQDDWMYRIVGNCILDHAVEVCEYGYYHGDGHESHLQNWYRIESAYRKKEYEPIRLYEIGLKNEEPYFCAHAYWMREELGITRQDALRYLDIAKEKGYSDKLSEQAIHDDITAEQRRHSAALRREEAAREAEERSKREALENRMDELERYRDMVAGGTGRTVEERGMLGEISREDLLHHELARDAVIDRLSK